MNFITCHDGFTLYDLVSYNEKHNQANGEDNRDGCNDNDSCSDSFNEMTPKQLRLIKKKRQENKYERYY